MRAVRDGFCDIRMPLAAGLFIVWAVCLLGVCALVWTAETFSKIVLAIRRAV